MSEIKLRTQAYNSYVRIMELEAELAKALQQSVNQLAEIQQLKAALRTIEGSSISISSRRIAIEALGMGAGA